MQQKHPLLKFTRFGDGLLTQFILRQFYRVDFDRVGNLLTESIGCSKSRIALSNPIT